MRVLVIGRTGQLARSLMERAPENWSIISAGRDEIDLFEPDAAGQLLSHLIANNRPAAVINAAAYTAVDAAEDDEARAMLANADAPGAMAAVAAAAGVPFLHLSTDYVFSGSSPAPYAEDAPVDPIGAYGRSKAAGEASVQAVGGDHAIIRTAWVFSPFGRNFVATMLRLAADRDSINVVDDQIGNPTSALDLSDALLDMIKLWPREGCANVYHFAGRGAVSWCGLAAAVMTEAAARGLPHCAVYPISTAEYPTRATRPAFSQLATDRLTADFGIIPRDWQAMLDEVMVRLAPA